MGSSNSGSFKPGHAKTPGSGRPRGAPNKVHRLEAICIANQIDLFAEAVELAAAEADPDKRFQKITELLPYLHPKQKAQEITVKSEIEEKAEAFEALPQEDKVAILEMELKKLKGEA